MLDSMVTREPKQPPFTTAGLLDHIVEMIVAEDEVSNIYCGIDIPHFQ